LPDYARNQHGNLAEQSRHIGPSRGTDTVSPTALTASPPTVTSAHDLAQKYACNACHQADRKLVGPSYADIAAKYRGNPGAEAILMAKVRTGGSGVWGTALMPPHEGIDDADLRTMVRWSLSGGK